MTKLKEKYRDLKMFDYDDKKFMYSFDEDLVWCKGKGKGWGLKV